MKKNPKRSAAIWCLMVKAVPLYPLFGTSEIPYSALRKRNKIRDLFEERRPEILTSYKEKRKDRLYLQMILDIQKADPLQSPYLMKDVNDKQIDISSIHKKSKRIQDSKFLEYRNKLYGTSEPEDVHFDCLEAVNQVIGNSHSPKDHYITFFKHPSYSSYKLNTSELLMVDNQIKTIQQEMNGEYQQNLAANLAIGMPTQVVFAAVLFHQAKASFRRLEGLLMMQA